jgi:hypothetical protein
LVKDALHLLALNRSIERDWRISGSETLRQEAISDRNCPWSGKIPITPMMDTQLDQIIIKDILTPLRNKVLLALQNKMQDGKKEDWFEIFLTMFVLSTSTEWLLRHSRGNALRYNAQVTYPEF